MTALLCRTLAVICLMSFTIQANNAHADAVTVNGQQQCGEGKTARPDVPFRITIDGDTIEEDSPRSGADRARCVDAHLEKADIQVRYDPLNVSPALNIWTTPSGILRDKPVTFYTYSNYALWIRHSEVRIFHKDQDTNQLPYAIVPAEIGSSTDWTPPADAPSEVFYLLRVYDEKGRFDETTPKQLTLLEQSNPVNDEEQIERERLTGYGENSLRLANIPVYGGTVTISGRDIQPGYTVSTLGYQTPVDRNGRFATRQIIPAGPRQVEVALQNDKGGKTIFRRSVSIAYEDWFYIAIADITIGENHVDGPVELVTGDDTHYKNQAYIDGRGAFYLKGKIKGKYLLTMSADTRERPLREIFDNFNSKDPAYLMRSIDPDKYYPVYGDDSTLEDDAPTQGKFYVRIERGDSHIMWGNYQTQWTDTELTQYSRSLYGANIVLKSEDTTRYGERRTSVNAFASEASTLNAHEEFRGTGGSLYYLKHMDVTQGSERVWLEVRDKDSGLVAERRSLAPSEDYTINYLQGRILLRAPLPSVTDGSTLVRTSALNGNPVYLTVTYEYAPLFTDINEFTAGGHVSQWFGDYFRLGLTGYRQKEEDAKQTLKGADVTLRYRPGTFIKVEAAQSQGPGTGTVNSATGGFDFNQSAGSDERADAWRIEGKLEAGEIWEGAQGNVSAYWQKKEEGFSAPGQIALNNEAVLQTGMKAEAPITDTTSVEIKADHNDSDSRVINAVEGSVHQAINDEWSFDTGARFDKRNVAVENASPALSQDGERTDAILRVNYKPVEKEGRQNNSPEIPRYKSWDVYSFAQGTIERTGDRDDNDRAGTGANWQATDRFRLGSEISDGDGGTGGKLSGDYRIDDRSNVYLTYTVETEQPDASFRGRTGTWVFGSRYQLNNKTGLFGESRWGHSAGAESLTNAFGLDYAPNDRWTYGVKLERGTLSDETAGDIDRLAVGTYTAYKFEKTRFASALEYRKDDSDLEEERTTWLMRNSLGYQVDPSWRLLNKFNFSYSDSDKGDFYNADFIEGVVGAAYRPVDNNKWNALFEYKYYYNLPPEGQVTANNSTPEYMQKSHVLSVDAIYDLLPWLSLGGKYGMRISELKMSRTEGDWYSSRADLMIGRMDFHFVHKWDILIEDRRLSVYEAEDERSGFLAAVYRHFNENVKAGIGYNFTDFSDDLTDLSYRSRGWFINIIASM